MELQTTQKRSIDAASVPGWAVDADPENDPTFPMKEHVTGEHAGYSWKRPEQQESDVEVLHSNERPNLAAAYGTTLPPAGLSGMIRRRAFDYSESSYGHWLPLMLADRVDMVEGLVGDLAKGKIPNIFGEMGWKADWKYDRTRFVTKVAVGSALAAGLIYLLTRRSGSESVDQGYDEAYSTADDKGLGGSSFESETYERM